MEASHKNFQVVVKNVYTFDGKNAADFNGWYEKICISLSIYDKAAFRVLQRASVPSAATDTDGSKLAVWNTANEGFYNVRFLTTKGPACSVVRRFAGKTLDGAQDTDNALGPPFARSSTAVRERRSERSTPK